MRVERKMKMENTIGAARFPTMVIALIAASVAGCGGGGGSSGGTTTPASVTTGIPIVAANSPFIGVMMKVECANGLSGQGVIGDAANPGAGVVNVVGESACTAPVKITAIGPGTMRPIGAKADGSGDMVYDPAVNLPISAIWMPPAPGGMPSATDLVSVSPVTSLVAYQVAPAGMTSAQLAALSPATVAASKAAVATALGLTTTDIDKDYRTAATAAAATRIVEVAALAAANSASSGTTPAGVGATKTLGQFMVEQLAIAANDGAPLTSAAGVANVFVADAGLNVTADPAVASSGVIDTDAALVSNMITQAANNAGTTPASVGAMLTQVANDPVLAADVTTHIQTQLTWGTLAEPTPPPATVCQVAIGNAVAYVTGATACTTAYLNDDSDASTVTEVSTPAGVVPYTFGSLATCTGLGAPPRAGDLTLVPCKV
ncbi:MAG: hypothetical protein A2143_06110 [Gallionellales bacterium RBG_16_57_15]|nr:MAG: hypothetical protein A2143_06110 [Gallionellales bacterium RBG_16_57_15]